jgi:hypothetical protein
MAIEITSINALFVIEIWRISCCLLSINRQIAEEYSSARWRPTKMRNMRDMINARSESPMNRHETPRVAQTAVAPDGGSFSIVTENGAAGSTQVALTADELPRPIVALLHAVELLARRRGDDRSLIFPIEKGSIAMWESDFVFRVTLTAGARTTFQLGRSSAASLLEALATAFHCPTLLRSATH